jgi:hypothetical protein
VKRTITKATAGCPRLASPSARNDNKGKDYENDLFLPFGKGLSPSHLIVNAHKVEIHPFEVGLTCKNGQNTH